MLLLVAVLPPMTHSDDPGFYGWPYSYWGRRVDSRVTPQRPELVAESITPDYALGGHIASLGFAHYDGTLLPLPFRGGMFIGQHGCWNRSNYSGYKVVLVPFAAGRPNGPALDVLTGFLQDHGKAYGRPVGGASIQHRRSPRRRRHWKRGVARHG
jgi:glucose/arabinose dehydrogenase